MNQGAAMLVSSLPMKSKKGLAGDEMYTSALHTGLANSISDTNCPALAAMFSQLSSAELEYKSTGKLL